MKKSNFNSAQRLPLLLDVPVGNLQMLGAADGQASPFAGMFQPDAYKAYIEFDLYHSFPQVIGPTVQGSFVGYHPAVLAKSHRSLLHQQMNLRHMLKAYNPNTVTRDRIVGCVVATSFPREPLTGWKIPDSEDSAPCIHCCAVVFKLAEGVADVIGKHQTSRVTQSVSGETWCDIEDIGIYRPSTREIWSMDTAPDDLLAMVSIEDGSLKIGQFNGEQLALAYGCTDRTVSLRGVGVTPRPAESTAEITAVYAEHEHDETYAVAAEAVDHSMLAGRVVAWDKGRYCGRVHEVIQSGQASVGGLSMEAVPENPLLKIMLPGRGGLILKKISQISH